MSKRLQAFQDFLATQSMQIPLWGFLFNIVLAAVLAYLLGIIYTRYGSGLTNRRQFSRNFLLLAMTTTLMIAIIKSSLALSLGLVGALSIVRFRAAIKEPEELTYLFLTIAIGLGCGAGQRMITLTAFVLMTAVIYYKHRSQVSEENQNLYMTVSSSQPKQMTLERIMEVLKQQCSSVYLKRFDETPGRLEAAFLVEFDTMDKLQVSRQQLQELGEGVEVSYLDNKGLA